MSEHSADHAATAGRESIAVRSPYKALADEIYRERVIRARAMSASEKILAGPRLFESACTITLAGIRNQFPGQTEKNTWKYCVSDCSFDAGGRQNVKIEEVMLRVSRALEAAGVPYMPVGSFSSNYHGIPRSTEDVDFVIEFESPLTADFARLLGNDFKLEPQLSFENNTGIQRQEFFVEGTAFKVELFRLSSDPFDQQRFRRKKTVEIEGRQVCFPTPEDVVIMKLRWARSKNIENVRDVISVQKDNLDWKYIEEWCKKHGTLELLNQIRLSAAEN